MQHINSAAEIPAQWWTLFHSPELDSMVSEALQNSPTLAEATARLKQAEEELNARTGATKYPSVSANASVQEEQLNLSAYGIPFPNPSPFTLMNGSVAVSYALDLFGANRHLVKACVRSESIRGGSWKARGRCLRAMWRQPPSGWHSCKVRSESRDRCLKCNNRN